MREWHIVFAAGFALGWASRWLAAKLSRTFKLWIVLVLMLSTEACALGVALRVAGAGASIGHAANEGKKALEAASQPERRDDSLAARQRRAREKVDADLAAYRAANCLR